MRLKGNKMSYFNRVRKVIMGPIILGILTAQEYKVITQQVSLSQSPMTSDSLVLKGSLGKNFHHSGNGDTLRLKGGLWNIAAGLYSAPPLIQPSFPDTVERNAKDVYAQAVVTDINGIKGTELHVQFGGSQDVIILPMESLDDSTYRVTISDSLRTVFNFRAHFVSEDGMENISKTAFNSPYMGFDVEELTMQDTFSYYPEGIRSESWRMFSFPGELNMNQVERSELEDGHVFYDWDPNNNTWVKPDTLKTGKGYWFKHRYSDPVIFKNKDSTGFAVPLEDYTIRLDKGCNMVGSPFSFPVRAELSDGVSLPHKYGSGNKEGWADTTVFEPWAGYAIESTTDNGTITFKPFSDSSIVARSVQDGWRMEIDVIGAEYFDRTGTIGRMNDADENIDSHDVPLLPSPGNSLRLLMDIGSTGSYTHSSDIRSTDEFNGVWNMQIQGNDDPGPIRLTASSMNGIPTDLRFAIIDVPNREVIRDFSQQDLTIDGKIEHVHDIILIAGEESYLLQMIDDLLADIPEQYSLGQNYPNPFNPITKIDFALPRTGEVSIVIYNLMGQQVRTLLAKNMEYGFHTITWNGLDQLGRPVSSGVYFSELRARGFRQTKKMLMLK